MFYSFFRFDYGYKTIFFTEETAEKALFKFKRMEEKIQQKKLKDIAAKNKDK